MKKIIKHPLVNAFLGTIIISGLVHIFVLWLQFVKTGNWDIFNYLRILDLDFFWKELTGTNFLIVSWIILIGIYLGVWYLYSSKKDDQ